MGLCLLVFGCTLWRVLREGGWGESHHRPVFVRDFEDLLLTLVACR